MNTRTTLATLAMLVLTTLTTPLFAQVDAAEFAAIDQMAITGTIDGANVTFSLDFEIDHTDVRRAHPLIRGDVALDTIKATGNPKLDYVAGPGTYRIGWAKAGRYTVSAGFAARAERQGDGWRQSAFTVPASRVRQLRLVCDRNDLEVEFPGALRQKRTLEDGKLVVTAILGPGNPFIVRWKPQVSVEVGELVYSANVNTIVKVNSASLRIDSLFHFDIPQGRLGELVFDVPSSLSVTQVLGKSIRDWRIVGEGDAPMRRLVVTLAQPQSNGYDLQLIGESVLGKLPTSTALPTVRLSDDSVRISGQLVIGTRSAVRIVVTEPTGVSQIDAGKFARRTMGGGAARTVPTASAFFYDVPTGVYAMTIAVEDVVPTYDVEQQMVIAVGEDDLAIESAIGLEVRDAAMRSVRLRVPTGFLVTSVDGPMVEDFAVAPVEGENAKPGTMVTVQFKKPVLGPTVMRLRGERGRTAVGAGDLSIGGVEVMGAHAHRGHVLVAGDEGVDVAVPSVDGLREVHTGSVKVSVAGARFAYRFRDAAWSLALKADQRPSGVRAESFHVVSLGEQMVYGSVAVNYFISGAPVDTLTFTVPDRLKHVEFVGADVRRWTREGDTYTVKLNRKVIGDYNLGVRYSYRYADGDDVVAGAVVVTDVDTQTGYVVLASHLNVELKRAAGEVTDTTDVIEIAREEIPGTYRLLVNAPILKTYKYITAPHTITHAVRNFARGRLLPVVVELTQIGTQIGVDENGVAESITTIRYKVKNSSAQFLALDIPDDADVWHTHIVETDANGNEQRTRVTASFDKENGRHMIQLPRKRNPNDPTTIDLQYARNHGEIGSTVTLIAPQSAVRSTFAGWNVRVGEDWALHAQAGNLLVQQRPQRLGDLSSVLGVVGNGWGQSLRNAIESGAVVWLGLLVGGILAVIAAVRRRWIGRALVVSATAVVLIWGIGAANHGLGSLGVADNLSQLEFTQPLNLDDAEPLTAVVSVTPAWRQHATFWGGFFMPIASIALIGYSLLKPRMPRVLVPLGIVGVCYGLAQFDVIAGDSVDLYPSLWLGYLFTWGLPLLAALYVGWRLRPARLPFIGSKSPAPVTAALLAMCVFTGAAQAQLRVVNLTPEHQVEAVDVQIRPDGDAMNVEYRFRLTTEDSVSFELLDTDAVLDQVTVPADQKKHVRVVTEDGHYRVVFGAAGAYDVKISMVTALRGAGPDGLRSYAMPMPPALSTRATLHLDRGEMDVESPNAIRLTHKADAKQTVSTAMFAPGDRARFAWKPRQREAKREKVVFFADVLSAVRFDTARATGRHQLRLQIAQGEVTGLRVSIPEGQIVTNVDGGSIGGWRFDPASSALEVRLSRPATGTLALTVTTESTAAGLPWSATLRSPTIADAARQMGSIGLLTTPAVYIETSDAPQPMNGEDFARAAGALLRSLDGAGANDVRFAYRTRSEDDSVTVRVHAVKPELRSGQNGAFAIEDGRLAFNSKLDVQVLKAGVFSFDLLLPADYDIDTLDAPGISHWDERPGDGNRRVTVHMKQKTIGTVKLTIALSQPITRVAPSIDVPHIEVVGSVKHTGQLVVQAERGLRLAATKRGGVSELNPADLGLRGGSALAYRLLQPDWSLTLGVEVVEPRITIDALHVAEISEGLVRHHHQVRFQMAHAGAKVFDLHVPTDALGLVIAGPDIANTKRVDEKTGLWRVELSRKYFDRPLLLTVRYETRFEMSDGGVELEPVRPLGADLYRGYVAVRATEKVELKPKQIDASLQPAESRSIPGYFPTAGLNLADAAYTYTTPDNNASLAFTAERHAAANQLGADVRAAMVTTVLNDHGQSINRIQLQMRVGSKRQLQARLPKGADVWSLTVNNRAVVPSIAKDGAGNEIALVPLAHSAGDELDVIVELIYVMDRPGDWRASLQRYEGPRFDLPLRNVRWVLFVPEGFEYSGFAGTLAVDEESVRDQTVYGYGLATYQQQEQRRVVEENQIAMGNIAKARDLAARGEQRQAKAALESAYHYSFNDVALNEDARVQLHRLNRQQAMIGLWSRRGTLRPQQAGGAVANDDDARYSQKEADSNLSQLDRADSDNLEKIAMSFIEAQEQAAGATVALSVHLPLRGRALEFRRPVQIEPDSPMHVTFEAETQSTGRAGGNLLAAGGLFAGVALLSLVLTRMTRRRVEPVAVVVEPAAEPDDVE